VELSVVLIHASTVRAVFPDGSPDPQLQNNCVLVVAPNPAAVSESFAIAPATPRVTPFWYEPERPFPLESAAVVVPGASPRR
jgi:hypothetical protein